MQSARVGLLETRGEPRGGIGFGRHARGYFHSGSGSGKAFGLVGPKVRQKADLVRRIGRIERSEVDATAIGNRDPSWLGRQVATPLRGECDDRVRRSIGHPINRIGARRATNIGSNAARFMAEASALPRRGKQRRGVRGQRRLRRWSAACS